MILPGVTIGRGELVGAGPMVTKNVEPYPLVAGAAAQFRRHPSRDLAYELGYAKRFA